MKNIFLVAFSAIIVLTSCSKNNYPTTPNPSPYPGNPYPGNEEVIIGRDGRVIRGERQSRSRTHLPPGQAKKIYGGKSAKVYAPGQQKKNNGTYQNNIPRRISVSDRNARRAANGQYYYTDNYGNVYWKANDGYYYLDQKGSKKSNNNYSKSKSKGKGKKY